MADIEVPVLIAGGSLVGLSSALLLGYHGIPSLTVEYHRGTAIHPRAAQCTQRTMEIFRSTGIEDEVLTRSEQQFVQDGGVVAVETLTGGVTQHFIANLNEGIRDVSPCVRVFLSQNSLEPVLKRRAEELGARLMFSTELASFEQDDQGVTAVIRNRDSGATQTVRAQYLIAADGAHSRIRQALGVRMRGHGVFSRSVTIYFRANMRSLLEGKQWAVVYVNNDKMRGFFRFEKPFDSAFLVINTLGHPDKPITDVSSTLSPERTVELVQLALGSTEIPVTVDNVMHWSATADTAERLTVGRVFIVGDAAHVMPPTGGFGGNTGIQGAHNLVWKLAMVLNGKADESLLKTYELERHPISEFTVEQAYTRYVLRTDPTADRTGMLPLTPELNIELGYIYRSPSIVSEPGGPELHENPRESKGRPGTRTPHMWLKKAGALCSSVDLCERNFVLLCGPQGEAWRPLADDAAIQTGIPIDAHQIGVNGLEDESNTFATTHGIEPSGCVLVRPDGFVAWRARNSANASARTLARVINQVLCRAA